MIAQLLVRMLLVPAHATIVVETLKITTEVNAFVAVAGAALHVL